VPLCQECQGIQWHYAHRQSTETWKEAADKHLRTMNLNNEGEKVCTKWKKINKQ